MFVEYADAFAYCGDPRMPQIDVDLRRSFAGLRTADEKRLDGERHRPIRGVPASVFEKQVLTILEAHQSERGEVSAFQVAAEKDGEFVLDAPELRGDGDAGHNPVAKIHSGFGADAKVAMRGRVENGVIAHVRRRPEP
jgi:hypothetical protein